MPLEAPRAEDLGPSGEEVVVYDEPRRRTWKPDRTRARAARRANPFGKVKIPVDAYCACLLDRLSFGIRAEPGGPSESEISTMAIDGGMMSEWKLREEMCEVGRRVYAKGFAAANDGNISFRLIGRSRAAHPDAGLEGLHEAG